MDREEPQDGVHDDLPASAVELAARVRVARAYCGKSQGYMAALLDMSVTTYKRLERGSRLPSLDEQTIIAEACGVPLTFLQLGWTAYAEGEDERRDLLIPLLRSLDDRFDAMVSEVVSTMLETSDARAAAGRPRRTRSRGAGRAEARSSAS